MWYTTTFASDVVYFSHMKKSLFALLASASLLAPSALPVLAQTAPRPGTLIKGSGTAVYWYSSVDNRRHVFPNMKTFFTWFSPYDFERINTISDAELGAIQIGDNITYRPGTKLIKITTDPKVYVVEQGHSLRWIESESVAIDMYGPHWQQFIDDVPDAFFVNYSVGPSLRAASAFRPTATFTPDATLR